MFHCMGIDVYAFAVSSLHFGSTSQPKWYTAMWSNFAIRNTTPSGMINSGVLNGGGVWISPSATTHVGLGSKLSADMLTLKLTLLPAGMFGNEKNPVSVWWTVRTPSINNSISASSTELFRISYSDTAKIFCCSSEARSRISCAASIAYCNASCAACGAK
jgi:hypothetical protein